MVKKSTDDLLTELQGQKPLDEFITENQDVFYSEKLAEILCQLVEDKGTTKYEVIKRAELTEVYGYQIFSGKRLPSRDKLICLCIGLGLTVDETQQLLKRAGMAPLYAKLKRDSIILYGIGHGQGVAEINERLYGEGKTTL